MARRQECGRMPAIPPGAGLHGITSISMACNCSRSRFSCTRASRTASTSSAHRSTSARSRIWPLLPPGAAQASSTRSPGWASSRRASPLRACVLHRHVALVEAGQAVHRYRAVKRDRIRAGLMRWHPRLVQAPKIAGDIATAAIDAQVNGGCNRLASSMPCHLSGYSACSFAIHQSGCDQRADGRSSAIFSSSARRR